MKHMKVLAILTTVLLLFTACRNGKAEPTFYENVSGFSADDAAPLSAVLTTEYSLKELETFFANTSLHEEGVFGTADDTRNLTMREVHRSYPIACLRKNGYSVYKVKEGGYFYVFWCSSTAPDGTVDDVVYFTAHLSALKKADDFDAIEAGVSTAEDVCRIDPTCEFLFQLSSRTPSYSLLDDGTVMEICYSFAGELHSKKDMIVESKRIVSRDGCPSRLASVNPADLP